MDKIAMLEQEIQRIQARNQKVEMDKAWERSSLRRITLAALTYIVVVLFFCMTQSPHPFINALVPTLGFILSTLSVSLLKTMWIKHITSHKK